MTEELPADLVLAAYAGNVPCALEPPPEACGTKAQYVLTFAHADGTPICGDMPPVPLCPKHKEATRHAFTGFWADYCPNRCTVCGERMILEGVTSL